MHTTFLRLVFGLGALALTAFHTPAAPVGPPTWPQFRGPGGDAVAMDGAPPSHFGPESNVVWKATVPSGHSSPCIWGPRIFLTAREQGHLVTLCLDRADGRVRWRQELAATSMEPTHRIGSPAASTTCTDGESVFVYFGSYGVTAYDLDGKPRWQQPLPTPMVEFGTGTSPILAGDRLIVLLDGDQGAYLLALDRRTGKKVWRTERPEFRRGFSTPYLWRHEGQEELVVAGSIWLRAYDPADGTERWSYTGTARVANSSPCAGDGLLFSASWNIGADVTDRLSLEPYDMFARANDADQNGRFSREEVPSGPLRDRFSQLDINKDGVITREEWGTMRDMFARAGNALLGIRPGGRGDITTTHVAWKSTRSLPYVCSPVCHEGRVYTVKNGGLVSGYEAKTGRVLYQDERLEAPGDYYASLVAGGGKVVAISQRGIATVLASGDALRILARNDLGAEVMATPALVEQTLYVRTASELFAFREAK